MKKILLSALALGLATITNAQTWMQQTSGTTETIKSLSFVDANTGYAAGFNNTVIKTTNGGTTWSAVNTPTIGFPLQFNSIYFVNPTNGWVLASVGIMYKTTDSGTTWNPCNLSGLPSGTQWTKVIFGDANNGYVTGVNSGDLVLGKSNDGGANWTQITINSTQGYAAGLQALGSNTVMITVNDRVWNSTNNGTSWTISAPVSNSSNLGSLKVFSYDVAFATNRTNGYNTVYQTLIHNNWLPTAGNGLIGGGYDWIDGYDPANLFVADYFGIALSTTDGGANWTLENTGMHINGGIEAIAYPAQGSIWVAGINGQIFKKGSSTTGIKDSEKLNSFNFYPNPSKNVLNIDIESLNSDEKITLTDVLGKTVYSHKTSDKKLTIDLSSLNQGIYFITVGNTTKKIIKE